MFPCIVVAEGEFEGCYRFDTEKERTAFQLGVTTGACVYGAGSCVVYRPGDVADSDRVNTFIKKYLEVSDAEDR